MATMNALTDSARKAILAKRQNSPEGRVATERDRLISTGNDTRAQGLAAVQRFDPNEFLGAEALQSVFDEATRTNFVPQLRGLQARNSRRGIRGPLAGALEGDLGSAFQRNLMARVAEFGSQRAGLTLGRARSIADIGGEDRAQGLSLLGTELELKLAREQAKKEERSSRRRGIGALIGGGAGFLLGGPAGALIGSQVGGSV